MSVGKVLWLLLLTLALWTLASAAEDQNLALPEVLIQQGRLQGTQIKVRGAENPVNVFLGIPYAKPPVGALRFSPPLPAEPWTDVRDATSYPPMCLQDPVMGQVLSDAFTTRKEKVSLKTSEDCLYLNIYTPVNSDKDAKLPVMVWIHGGGLLVGAASTYDGSALAAYEDVVVVAMQYRLGILGFLSTGDEIARGNWGFLDQVAALQWIHENIAHFGGDRGSVTIFGESAGGFSTSALLLSPLAKGLFHKAISESGVSFMAALIEAHPENQAKKISKAAGCETSSSAEMIRCLKGKTEDEILQTTLKMDFTKMRLDSDEKHTTFFLSNVDGVFLPKEPKDLMAEKKISNIPYIIGVNNHETGWLIPNNVAPEHHHIVVDEYLKSATDPIQIRDQLLEMWGDAIMVAPSIQTARYHRDAGYRTYFYEFQHRPSAHANLKPAFVKSDHGDEIGFVFGKPFLAGDGTEEEEKLSKTMMKYWANFARTGDPNSGDLVRWPAYDQNEQYLEIGLKQQTASKLKEKQVVFWSKILPEKLAESKKSRTEL